MRLRAMFLLLACLALAACADNDKRTDSNDRFGGWYSGTTGGASR